MHVRAKMREEETLLKNILRYCKGNSSFIKENFSQLTWHFSLWVWHVLTRGRPGLGEVEKAPNTGVNSRHTQCWRKKNECQGTERYVWESSSKFPNGSFSPVSILEGWLLICSICSGSLLWVQSKLSALCRRWLIQAALQASTCDPAVALASLGRAGDRRRDGVAAGECWPALHHRDPCRAALGEKAQQPPLVHWCLVILWFPLRCVPEWQLHMESQQGRGRQGPSQCLTALSLCPLVA